MRHNILKVGLIKCLATVTVITVIAYGTNSLNADTFDVTLQGISYWYDG